MTDKSREPGLEFPINQKLLEEATHIREQWRVVKDRLDKIDTHKSAVSKVVFEKVRKDYMEKLNNATGDLTKVKTEVDKELSGLKITKDKITSQLNEHKNKLEEINFRNSINEFSEDEYKACSKAEEEKINKFESVLNAVNNNISRYQAIFAEVEHFVEEVSGEIDIRDEPPSETQGELHEELPEEPDGPDYFGEATERDKTNPKLETTDKAIPTTGAGDKQRARVVIVNGDTAGDTYPLKGVVSLGRAESNTIVLRDAKISRQHAQIQQQGNEFIIIDLNSSNGTFVNSQRIEEYVLSNGDEIQIGDFTMQFQQ